uniref:Calcineurin-like phosphoesterase domain-containing protein n=1 Tax=Phytophthora ramorum TaxID=164328 RepID=H3GWP0_PHYRM
MLNAKILINATAVFTIVGVSSALVVTSDPASAKYSVSAFATGDWGTTLDKGSNSDVNAQDVVASIMDIQAGNADVKPKVVLGHGDSFYWNGINNPGERDSRFMATFDSEYNGANIKNVAWANVMGNHDYGGADYICNSGDKLVSCNSTEELFRGLDNKLKWQAEYKSPNNGRWMMKDHFYVHRIEDTESGVSIDVFNVDTNDADVHGVSLVCCQCYGYAKADSGGCGTIARGDKYCCGGDNALYDACMNKFTEWGDDSRAQLAEKVASSTATWKIVNSHYSPYEHYLEPGMNKWFDVLRNSGVRAFLYGHTHGEKHDYSPSLGIHFVENGAGGGARKEAASSIPSYATKYVKNEWTYTPNEYGFFSVEASKDWLKLQYHTTDDNWGFTEKYENTTVGGVATKHCWYIPADGSEGKAC